MNVNKIFSLATSYFNVANDAHLRALAAGQTTTPPTNGVTIFARMFYGTGPRMYRVVGYRIPNEKKKDLGMDEWIEVRPEALDETAKAAGYQLTSLPEGYTHQLVYRPIDPEQPPSGYTTSQNQMTSTHNKRAREARIMAAGSTTPEDLMPVVHVGGLAANSASVLYCGPAVRGWHKNVLENPHHMKSEADRQTAIDLFEQDIDKDIAEQGEMYKRLRQIQARVEAGHEVKLGCWCAPKACHCHVIRKKVIWLMTAQPNAPRLNVPEHKHVFPLRPQNTLGAGVPAPSEPMDEPEEPIAPVVAKRFNLVVAIGSDLKDYNILAGALDASLVKMTASSTTMVLHTGAVNIHLQKWAAAHNLPINLHKADWVNGGVTAQDDRDEKMLADANGVLVVWSGVDTPIENLMKRASDKKLPMREIKYARPCGPQPTGQDTDINTKHMIETAQAKGLPVKIVKYAPAPVNMEAPPEPEE